MHPKDQAFPQAKNTLVELATELQYFQAELDLRYPPNKKKEKKKEKKKRKRKEKKEKDKEKKSKRIGK